MTRGPTGSWDPAVSAVRSRVDDLGAWLAIWSARTEPDAHARRCASSAVDAIDATLAGLHGIRARLIGEIRASDDETAVRADALLARMREGPPGAETASGSPPRRPPPDASLTACPAAKLRPSIAGGDDSGGDPR